mgnify:CR=1 FL=1
MLNSQRVIRNEFRRSKIDGIRQGRIDGMKQRTYEIIKSMLKENLPITLISKITNMPEEEIKQIKEVKM